jgi:hypothetical protein
MSYAFPAAGQVVGVPIGTRLNSLCHFDSLILRIAASTASVPTRATFSAMSGNVLICNRAVRRSSTGF